MARGHVTPPARPWRRHRGPRGDLCRGDLSRCVRAAACRSHTRYKYMRRYDDQHPGRVLANLDDSLTKDVLLAAGWGDVDPPSEALFDLLARPLRGTEPHRRSRARRGGRGPAETTARLDGPDRGPTAQWPRSSGSGHRREHGRPDLRQRPHDTSDGPQPHAFSPFAEHRRFRGLKPVTRIVGNHGNRGLPLERPIKSDKHP